MPKPIQAIPPIDCNQRYTIDETNAYLRQSRAKTYHDIAAGLLNPIKDGRRVYIPGSQIIARSRPPSPSNTHTQSAV